MGFVSEGQWSRGKHANDEMRSRKKGSHDVRQGRKSRYSFARLRVPDAERTVLPSGGERVRRRVESEGVDRVHNFAPVREHLLRSLEGVLLGLKIREIGEISMRKHEHVP
jgi:hypothetical protein